MRRPIRIQLLLPTLSVVILAIVLASGTSAYLGATQARRQQEESLHRIADTLAKGSFPLTERVLQQASQLSGAEIVFLDMQDRVQSSTLPKVDPRLLRMVQVDDEPQGFSPGSRVVIGGQAYLSDCVATPQRGAAWDPGRLIILYPEDRWGAVTRRATYPALVSGALASLVVVLVTTLLAQRFVRPIQKLGDQTAAIASGRFEPVAVPRRDDEIRDLAVSINRMTQQLNDYEGEVRRSERLRTLGQLGAAVAHQLRNSATGARMAIELHGLSCPEGLDAEALQVALRQLKLMESYLQRFLTLGRPAPEARGPVDLGALAEEVLDLVGPMASHSGVRMEFREASDAVEVEGDREALRQLLVNLVVNAIEAASRESSPQPRAVVLQIGTDRGKAVLAVGDTGPGPDEATRQRMFEPFVTEKPEGTGLGLYVVRQIATAHGGTVGCERKDGKTWFEVQFPLLVRTQEDGTPADCR